MEAVPEIHDDAPYALISWKYLMRNGWRKFDLQQVRNAENKICKLRPEIVY
jgi:hypothetical protein